MSGNIGNINSHPFNLLTFFPLTTLFSVYIHPSAGPQQPQLGGTAEFLVRNRVAPHHKSEKASVGKGVLLHLPGPQPFFM